MVGAALQAYLTDSVGDGAPAAEETGGDQPAPQAEEPSPAGEGPADDSATGQSDDPAPDTYQR